MQKVTAAYVQLGTHKHGAGAKIRPREGHALLQQHQGLFVFEEISLEKM